MMIQIFEVIGGKRVEVQMTPFTPPAAPVDENEAINKPSDIPSPSALPGRRLKRLTRRAAYRARAKTESQMYRTLQLLLDGSLLGTVAFWFPTVS